MDAFETLTGVIQKVFLLVCGGTLPEDEISHIAAINPSILLGKYDSLLLKKGSNKIRVETY